MDVSLLKNANYLTMAAMAIYLAEHPEDNISLVNAFPNSVTRTMRMGTPVAGFLPESLESEISDYYSIMTARHLAYTLSNMRELVIVNQKRFMDFIPLWHDLYIAEKQRQQLKIELLSLAKAYRKNQKKKLIINDKVWTNQLILAIEGFFF